MAKNQIQQAVVACQNHLRTHFAYLGDSIDSPDVQSAVCDPQCGSTHLKFFVGESHFAFTVSARGQVHPYQG